MNTLTKKQSGFVKDYLDTGNGTQAVLRNYNIRGKNKENIAAVIAKENLIKPQIKDALSHAAPGALARIIDISITAENEAVRLSANKDILDRAGYRPSTKIEATVQNQVPRIIGMRIIDMSQEKNEQVKQVQLKNELITSGICADEEDGKDLYERTYGLNTSSG